MSDKISLVTFNVRGLRDVKKRRSVFRHMHVKYPSHIIVLQETHSTEDVERRWIAEWGGHIIFSHGIANARGTCIMIPKNHKGEVIGQKRDQEGRIISIMLNLKNVIVNIVGVYAPTQGHCRQQSVFITELLEHIRLLELVYPLILCGDLNTHLSALDTSQKSFKPSSASTCLRELMSEFNLRDVWRHLNPDKQQFTWRKCRPFQQSRIDYFLVSDVLIDAHQISRIDIEPGHRSDHSIVVMEVKVFGGKRGPGVWKMNLSLLANEDVVQGIREEIERAKNRLGQYHDVQDLGLLIEMLLSNIRVICIKVSKNIAKEKRKNERDLEKCVKQLEELVATQPLSDTLRTEYYRKKDELDDIKLQAAERAMLWSRANWLECGEKPTKYFLNLQKKKIVDREIHVLEDADGNKVTGDRHILNLCKTFYDTLHQSRGISDNLDNFMQNVEVPKLSEHDRLVIMRRTSVRDGV